jgi:ATP-dependent Clp protease ATP-binding subunit ClpC
MIQRFTVPARKAVGLAQDEARGLGHDHVGTEHLLLGLVREDAGGAARILGSLRVTPDAVRELVVELLGRGNAVATGRLVFTPRAKKALELAYRASGAMRHSSIGTEHLLVGIVEEGGGVANHILGQLGADDRRILDAVADRLPDGDASTPE